MFYLLSFLIVFQIFFKFFFKLVLLLILLLNNFYQRNSTKIKKIRLIFIKLELLYLINYFIIYFSYILLMTFFNKIIQLLLLIQNKIDL